MSGCDHEGGEGRNVMRGKVKLRWEEEERGRRRELSRYDRRRRKRRGMNQFKDVFVSLHQMIGN